MIRALIDWLRGRSRPAPPPSRPSYELVLRVDGTDGDGRFVWSLKAVKGGGSGYWSRVPQPWSVRVGDEIVSDGTWTYDFRFTDEHSIAAGRSTLRPDNATALVAHFGTLAARLAPLGWVDPEPWLYYDGTRRAENPYPEGSENPYRVLWTYSPRPNGDNR